MADRIEAIYEKGHLRLLSPVKLIEGQRVHIAIESAPSHELFQKALGDLVAHFPDLSDDSDAELEDLAEEIDHALQGQKPLSEMIIEDRTPN